MQAMSSTKTDVACHINKNAGAPISTTAWPSAIVLIRRPLFVSGYSCSSGWATRSISARASSTGRFRRELSDHLKVMAISNGCCFRVEPEGRPDFRAEGVVEAPFSHTYDVVALAIQENCLA